MVIGQQRSQTWQTQLQLLQHFCGQPLPSMVQCGIFCQIWWFFRLSKLGWMSIDRFRWVRVDSSMGTSVFVKHGILNWKAWNPKERLKTLVLDSFKFLQPHSGKSYIERWVQEPKQRRTLHPPHSGFMEQLGYKITTYDTWSCWSLEFFAPSFLSNMVNPQSSRSLFFPGGVGKPHLFYQA